jgi:4-amino-4-deoxy-L-arabinose transferase-like glycosyltransferase
MDAAMHNDSTVPPKGRPWWLEWEVGLLIVLVSVLYFARLDTLTIRGEESRRARVAVEMIDSGDWLVPRQQGQLYFSRPPLQNWAIAAVGLIRGKVDTLAIRLPSVLAVLGVVLLIYGYGRTFLSRTASLGAAVAFASMVQVVELGRLGETDMLFTLFVSGSLLVWHWGHTRGWAPIRMWTAAYLLVALGTLAKGPQAPVYFAATIGVYLLLTGRWRDALSWSHLAGIAVFAVVVGAWQVPYHLEVGWQGVLKIYGRNVVVRFDDTTWWTYVKHFYEYPAEILFGCLLPWSFLLIAYINRDFRRSIISVRGHVLFLVTALVVAFSTLWFVPTARSRYFLPLYPCFALLIGLVLDRIWQAGPGAEWRLLWRWFLGVMAIVMCVAAIVVPAAPVLGARASLIVQPGWFAAVYSVVAVVLAMAVFWSRPAATTLQRVTGLLGVAAFVGVTFVGVFTNSLARRSVDTAGMVARLKQELPEDAHLVSLGRVHHLFTYYYHDMIELVPVPGEKGARYLFPEEPEGCSAQKVPDLFSSSGMTYFCFYNATLSPDDIPFPFETVAVISCDRFRTPNSKNVITVGRRDRLAPAATP